MNNTCVILVLFFALVSCILSSYLDIPPPPERPVRFKTKEQIENYLKAVKDYYDAFKVKLVRRDDAPSNLYAGWPQLFNDDNDRQADELHNVKHLLNKFYHDYKQEQPTRRLRRAQEPNRVI